MDVITFGEWQATEWDGIMDLFFCDLNDSYYLPPINFKHLAKLLRIQPHHESALAVKANILSVIFKENQYLNFEQFSAFITDLLVFGNGYLNPIKNQLGGLLKLEHTMARYVRVKKKKGFVFIVNNQLSDMDQLVHVKEYDINQNIYGMPKYISGLLSAVLNQSATKFRVRYYDNGSHAGFILSINGDVGNDSMENIKTQLKNSKGQNNFKNMLIHLPKGDKDSVKLIPISEIAAKDEFLNIKNVSRDDILAIHRVPQILMSIPPTHAGGYGDPANHAKVFYMNEIMPIVKKLEAVNTQLGIKVFDFNKYTL